MIPKDCFSCKESKTTGACTLFFCELLKRQVWGYSRDKDCPLEGSANKNNKNNLH